MFGSYWQQPFFRSRESSQDYKDAVDSIISKHFLAPENIFDGEIQHLMYGENDDLRITVLLADSNLERMTAVKKLFESSPLFKILKSYESYLNKNRHVSELLSCSAEKCNKSSDLKGALRCLNLALVYSPLNCQSRELIVMKLDTVIKSINSKNASRKDRRSQKQLSEKTIRENERFFEKVIFDVVGEQSTTLPSASAHLAIKDDRLVTTVPLDPGMTTILDGPFVCTVTDSLAWNMDHCWKCFGKISGAVPCPTCVFAVYCSDACQQEDLKSGGHFNECPCLPLLHLLHAPPCLQLALRAICLVGPENLQRIFVDQGHAQDHNHNRKDHGSKKPQQQEQEPPKLAKLYEKIFSLKSSPECDEYLPLTWKICAVLTILEQKTDFFKFPKLAQLGGKAARNDFVSFVGSILLDHYLAFESCAIKVPAEKSSQLSYLTGVYPLISRISHNCAPNSFLESTAAGKLAVVTYRPLERGEELSISRGVEYHLDYAIFRRPFLETLRIFCKCDACREDWPREDELSTTPTWLCERCRDTVRFTIPQLMANECFMRSERTRARARDSDKFACQHCHFAKKFLELAKTDKIYTDILRQSYRLMRRGMGLEAFPLIVSCIDYFYKTHAEPSKKLLKAQSMLRDVISSMKFN